MASIQLWRPAGQFVGTRHGLNTGPDEHAVTTERTLIFEGPLWTRDDGVEMVGPLAWNREAGVPSRLGPPNWLWVRADFDAWMLAHRLSELWGDELVYVP